MEHFEVEGMELGKNDGDGLPDSISIPSTYGRKRKRSEEEREHSEGMKGLVRALNRLIPGENVDQGLQCLCKQAQLMKMLNDP